MHASSPTISADARVPAVLVANCSVELAGTTVIDGVSFEVAQGQIVALIGPNGSGKTTLMRAMLGLIPYTGEVRILGKHAHAMRPAISYVPQRFAFDREFPITVHEFLDLARRPHCPVERIAEKIKEVGLPRTILDRRLGTLSGGQLQRILLAQAILNNPAILFLDEPSAGVDVAGEQTLYDIIAHLNKEHRTTVVMVSHDLAVVARLVDRVICVNRQLLCFGTPKEALTEKTLSQLFGPANFFEHKDHH